MFPHTAWAAWAGKGSASMSPLSLPAFHGRVFLGTAGRMHGSNHATIKQFSQAHGQLLKYFLMKNSVPAQPARTSLPGGQQSPCPALLQPLTLVCSVPGRDLHCAGKRGKILEGGPAE